MKGYLRNKRHVMLCENSEITFRDISQLRRDGWNVQMEGDLILAERGGE